MRAFFGKRCMNMKKSRGGSCKIAAGLRLSGNRLLKMSKKRLRAWILSKIDYAAAFSRTIRRRVVLILRPQ